MVWIRNATVNESFLKGELEEMRVQIRCLRERRRKAAAVHFGVWVARQSFPCLLRELLANWGNEASIHLVTETHMGRRSRPLVGFGPGWAMRQLAALGYAVKGSKKRVRIPLNKRNEWGELAYRFETADSRTVDAPADAI